MTRTARRTRRMLPPAGVGVAALLALSACSHSDGATPAKADSSRSAAPGLSGTVTVFAAASLKESFTTLGEQFEQQHPGTKVAFNFGGSDTLAASITSGAPADVFAAASPKTMSVVTDRTDTTSAPSIFARNQLEIATLPGNPGKVSSLKDLTDPGLKVVLCDRTVPCGAAAQKVLDTGGVKVTPVSYEQDVKAALNKVELKEADASLVYRTDVKSAGGKVRGVEFPESKDAINDYPIAPLKSSKNADAAAAFIALVKSPDGQKVLSRAGFLKP
ncbi:molybdate ABC transporter substrate-binding protein [Streptomyces griseoluteus]|uniref:Molybdate ABC transporter substrate-binding protein n=1 Tax=Streptomyces griseoluteus TaxID=29306 RepID=A0A4Z1DL85_STRGP|nr:molybdate ABC transporter substrate-binding protein [Streptomyces griseoluteus]TGN84980.1 molybdate ABC transporter substrate-binding protein [Streptomyces griseoluteus]GHF02951.1 molybdate-binding protein [Streptomyces griseoluteus]